MVRIHQAPYRETMKVITAPYYDYWWGSYDKKSLFLAGSIDLGKAEKWQDKAINQLADTNLTIFNPRRDDDIDWESPNTTQFREQVQWELYHLEKADYVLFYFDPNGKAPITLLELGLMVMRQHLKRCQNDNNSNSIFVCCPEGYWRKGNVDITCEKYFARMVNTLDDAIQEIRKCLS